MLSVRNARKILGDESKDLTDEEIEVDIEVASLLKEFFFQSLLKSKLINT